MNRPRYKIVSSTRQGTFIVNRHDLGVGWQLARNGAYDPDEMFMLQSLVTCLARDDLVVLDIGANIGVHAVCLAEMVGPRGRVHSFEAQRIIFNMLAGNVALNSLENVFCHHAAVGAAPGKLEIPQFDYGRPLSFGSVEFGERQVEPIGQDRRHAPDAAEFVRVVTVDGLDLPVVHLMKIDVEGMELDVIEGATETIRRDQPVLFVEYLKGDRPRLAARLLDEGYRLFIHRHNWLCLPRGSRIEAKGAREITSVTQC